jgi:WD40 repeat protein
MNKELRNRFVTGSSNGCIRVWRRDNQDQFYCKYELKQHQHGDRVNALVVNALNNLIISGSNDHKIILWKYIAHGDWVAGQTLTHQDSVLSLSLSNS